ncbi:ABC transporter [Frankia canadensis]|uniref:ABC transporter n=1 Tax=Frankia canadensis TaxID=1836972 RepID=A0A2I2KMD9_9ACTN|nr:ATP-binding cassette domain-containing protein [Frankia canadensis]SNQ46830.1 ABC transporter [Frankia canadensis]SOU54120.1 ABC transporter [Frankia canadensis]
MQEFFQFALLGLGGGAIVALLAQGIVLIYRGSGVVNFAHGAFALAGAYIVYELRTKHGWPAVPAMVVSAIVAALFGVLVQVLIMRPLRTAPPLSRVIATLGVLATIQSIATIRYGGTSLVQVTSSLPSSGVKIIGVNVGQDRLWLLAIAVVVTVVVWAVTRFTTLGLAISASAANERAAATLGWSPNFLACLTWAFGGAIASMAGSLVAPITGLSVVTFSMLLIAALAAALLGGFSSMPLVLLGGLVIGITQSEFTNYVKLTGAVDTVPFVAIILVLIVRGRSLPLRSFVSERPAVASSGRLNPFLVIGLAAVAIVLELAVLPDDWLQAVTISLTFGLFALSVIVLTGWAGQLSLAQIALGGVGALGTGLLVAKSGWPFIPALIAGIAIAVVGGLLFALPALRTRGINLAVVTFGLGFAVQQMAFQRSGWTGGADGLAVGAQKVFGFDIDPLVKPANYAVFCVVCLTLATVVVANIRRGRTGRRMLAVRTNERAAAALGISVFSTKLYAFAVSAGVAGLAGVLLAFQSYNIVYGITFDPFSSVNVVLIAVIGGLGYLSGPLYGSLLVTGGVGSLVILNIFGEGTNLAWINLFGGIVLLLTLLTNRNGIAHANRETAQRLRRLLGARRQPAAATAGATASPDTTASPNTTASPDSTASAQASPSAGATTAEPAEPLRHRVTPRTLTVRGLTVRFGGVVAVNNVDITVRPGEVVGLLGPNGAGKTTLIDAITGFVNAAGEATLDDQRLHGRSPSARARTGLARSFQSLELFEDISVRDNLVAASDDQNKRVMATDLVWPGRISMTDAATAAVAELELAEYLDSKPDDLPYGVRRQVAIARAVAAAPSVLLLDEPAAGLDEHESRELGHLIRRLADEWGMGILLVEHDVAMVMRTADRVVVLEFGKKIADATPAEVRNDPAVIAAYLGTATPDDDDDADAPAAALPVPSAETVSSEAVSSEAVSSEAAPVEVTPAEATPTADEPAGPAEASASEPAPADAAPVDAAETESAETESAETGAAETESAETESAATARTAGDKSEVVTTSTEAAPATAEEAKPVPATPNGSHSAKPAVAEGATNTASVPEDGANGATAGQSAGDRSGAQVGAESVPGGQGARPDRGPERPGRAAGRARSREEGQTT